MTDVRLGDIIDDHCSRCRLVTNHSVVSTVNGSVGKVRCRTCSYEHDYRHGKGGVRKKKLSAYEEVLAKLAPAAPESAAGDGAARRKKQ